MPISHDAVIIGGGHNGLVCAAYLARAGLDVLVLERRDILGGACITEELFPGYRFSACAYYCHLLQSTVIEDLELRRHGFRVSHIDPQKIYLFPDGRSLLVWDSVELFRGSDRWVGVGPDGRDAPPRQAPRPHLWNTASPCRRPEHARAVPARPHGGREENAMNPLRTTPLRDLDIAHVVHPLTDWREHAALVVTDGQAGEMVDALRGALDASLHGLTHEGHL